MLHLRSIIDNRCEPIFAFRFSSDSVEDKGTKAKRTRHTGEFKAKAARLPTKHSSYLSEMNAVAAWREARGGIQDTAILS